LKAQPSCVGTGTRGKQRKYLKLQEPRDLSPSRMSACW